MEIKVYNTIQLSKTLGVNPSTIHRWIKKGKLDYIIVQGKKKPLYFLPK